jgi:DNA polymerase
MGADAEDFNSEASAPINTFSNHKPANGIYLGYAESTIFQVLENELSGKISKSEMGELFQKARDNLIRNKLNLTLKDLHTQTINCRKCTKISPFPNLPMWNVKNPDVVFVLEYPIYSKEVAEILMKILKKAGFNSSQVCLSYVNRCNYPRRKFEQNEIANCSPYLHIELQLMNPKIIVCLGSLPAYVLYGKEIQIKDYRGRINFIGSWPVAVTYSPYGITRSGESNLESMNSDFQMIYNYVYEKDKHHESN